MRGDTRLAGRVSHSQRWCLSKPAGEWELGLWKKQGNKRYRERSQDETAVYPRQRQTADKTGTT